MGRDTFLDPLGLAAAARERRTRRTLGEALDALLEATAAKVAARARSAGTLTMQTQHARWLRRNLGADRPLARIDEALIERLATAAGARGGRDGEPLDTKTVQKLCSTLRQALKLAARRRWISEVPRFPEFCMPPLEPKAEVFANGADFWRLYRALPRQRAVWMALAFFTAQHASDVERMTWADVSIGPKPWMLIRNTKNRRPAFRVSMPVPLARLLREHQTRTRAARTAPIVKPWQNRAIMLARACIRLGMPPINANGLRHAATSAMVRRLGITPAAQKWGGWSSVRMMEVVYAHALPAELNQLASELANFVGDSGGVKDRG